MLSFELFQSLPDSRRRQGQRYPLAPFLTAILLAVLSGATSYRKMALFMTIHRERLNALLQVQWAATPTYVAIRHLLIGLQPKSFEKALREQAKQLAKTDHSLPCFAIDGKVLCGSLQRLEDKRAQQLLSVFAHQDKLVLGHYDIDDKSNEIPAARKLIKQLDLGHCLYTMDAMHCQKNSESSETTGR